MPKLYFDVDQGSERWQKLRAGIPTASEAHHVVTPKKLEASASRHKYACRIIAARLLNWTADSLDKIEHIEDGRAGEPFAIAQLEEIYEIETRRLGFATTNDGRVGASPDRVVMNGDVVAITVEAKCPTVPVQLERLLFGNGEEYRVQILSQLWVTEADKAIYYSWNPRMPAFKAEFGRDESAIKKIADALERFSDELDELTLRAKALGAFQQFAAMVTPAQRDYADNIRRGPYAPPSEADIDALINAPYGEFG